MNKFLPHHYADQPRAYEDAAAGVLPAEALTPRDRRLLVRELVADGLTDAQIARHTGWTLYTAARIRDSISLPPNQPKQETAHA
ncbi:hypothetical protein ACWCPQ_17000 [Nocardia sp. NPDC001965]